MNAVKFFKNFHNLKNIWFFEWKPYESYVNSYVEWPGVRLEVGVES